MRAMKVQSSKFKVQKICLRAAPVILAFLFFTAQAIAAEKTDFQFKKQPEIQQVRPQKPVKVKLHRNAKGDYWWELSGDNVDEIVNQDKKLRKLLKIQ
ncbi:MAG TPA: hypothetical protein VN328_08670 [Thermodesulfovibrionales bacterium]|nr:hypothetical protein [Thermodesulfovibrionales bacterium]